RRPAHAHRLPPRRHDPPEGRRQLDRGHRPHRHRRRPHLPPRPDLGRPRRRRLDLHRRRPPGRHSAHGHRGTGGRPLPARLGHHHVRPPVRHRLSPAPSARPPIHVHAHGWAGPTPPRSTHLEHHATAGH